MTTEELLNICKLEEITPEKVLFIRKIALNIWQLQKKVVILQPERSKGYNANFSCTRHEQRERRHDVYV